MGRVYTRRVSLPVSAAAAWKWHEAPEAFGRLNPSFDPVEVVERSGGLEVGARTVIAMQLGPVPQKWVAVHTACEPGRMFQDTQESGPFTRWVHTHRFLDAPGGSVLEDSVDYELPMGFLGQTFGGPFAQTTLERLFDYRHRVTTMDLERHARFADQPKLTVAVSGASGLIGTALKAFLGTGGHTVRAMKRGQGGNAIDVAALEGADAVVHLAGAGVAEGRWTDGRKKEIIDSRVAFTRALVEALGSLKQRPKVLLSGSAMGIYGDRGDELVDESSAAGPRGDGRGPAFLSKVCEDWEAEAVRAEKLGMRVALLRTGVVLTPKGGALKEMLPPFKAGVGGPISGGKQWMSWICLEDTIGAIHHALYTDGVSGPVNLVSPSPVTNAEFSKTLGKVLSRPAVVPVPAFALKLAFGEMAEGTLLPSLRVKPSVLEKTGFAFVHPQLEQCLRFCLGK